MFTFLVGPEEIPIDAHSQVIAALSRTFDRMINGDTKKAHENCTKVNDVEMETFLRAVEFVYTGDYSWPIIYDWDAQDEMANKAAKVRKFEAPNGQEGVAVHDESCRRHRSYIVTNKRQTQNYGRSHGHDRNDRRTFLTHAKLYLLTHHYKMVELKCRVLTELTYASRYESLKVGRHSLRTSKTSKT